LFAKFAITQKLLTRFWPNCTH